MHTHTHEDCWKEKEQGGTDNQGFSAARLKSACGLLRQWAPSRNLPASSQHRHEHHCLHGRD